MKIDTQSSLQSFPIEMSDPVARPFIMLPCYACWDRLGGKGTVPVCVVVMSVLFASDTVDP